MADLQRIPDSDVLYRVWESPHQRAVLLLIHGLGAYSGRWHFLGDYFKTRHITSYALELKGFGATDGPRGHIDSFRIYDRDIARLMSKIRNDNHLLPVFLYGESMGGFMALNYAAKNPINLSGLIVSSPVFRSILPFSLSRYMRCFTSLLFKPTQSIDLPFTTDMCTSDPEVRKSMDADPLELRTASAKLLINILKEQSRAGNSAKHIQLPVLFLTAGHDQFGDNLATRRIFDKIKGRDKTYLFYPDMLHVLHVEREREQVFKDVEAWLEDRI